MSDKTLKLLGSVLKHVSGSVSYASFMFICSDQANCPLCGLLVPANTEHTCSKTKAER